MIFKKRTANSAEYPKLLEYLQNGILVRFNISEITEDDITSFMYDEFWFTESATGEQINEVLAEDGLELNQKQLNLLII